MQSPAVFHILTALAATGLGLPLHAQKPARVAPPSAPVEIAKRPPAPEAQVGSPARFARPELASTAPHSAAGPKQAHASQPAALPPFDRKQVFHSSEDDGTPWVRGESYKARFGTEGASYIPFLGSAAQRNFPLDLHLESVALGGEPIGFDAGVSAKSEGETMRYERGSLTELYSVGVDSIEQSFVFDALPQGASGELVLHIAAASEMQGEVLADRIEFANELGSVRYGLATAIDAAGARVAAETALEGSELVIRVPADFVAQAKLPLTVDPVISTFSIDTGTPNAFTPDCSYDLASGCWLVVHEEVFSANDHDVVWRRIGVLNGLSLGSGYVDSNLSAYWANPACADNNAMGRFFVVAQVGFPTSGQRKIYGRTVQASNGVLGTTLDLGAEDPFADLFNPDVGGDPDGSLPSYFCVVWEKTFSSTDHDIYFRMVDPGNSLAGAIQIVDISGGTYDSEPSISKSNGGSTWNMVWQRDNPYPWYQDIRGARIGWSGSTVNAAFSIDNGILSADFPKASSSLDGSDRWAVVYATNYWTDHDIEMKLMDGATVVDEASLTYMEQDAGNLHTLDEDQTEPDVDTDGWSFAVAYAQSFGGTSSSDYDVYVSTVAAVGNQLQLSEGPRQIAGSVYSDRHPSIASAESSGLDWRLELIVLDSATSLSTSGNIVGGLYDNALFTSFCHPSFDGVPNCPCSNAPAGYGRGCNNSAGAGGAQLVAGGISSLGSDSMWLVSQFEPASALTVIFQSNTLLGTPVIAGQAVRCVGGGMKRLYTRGASGGAVSVPAPGDPAIHVRSAALGDPISAGTPRYYFAYYRDPVVLGTCAPNLTFNLSQTVQAIWIP
ncbi:MAG: hypothetical protein IPJ19_19820 [Planctomycetes bacterium]|nr:hypothetical protein [Planctomycetota bacterium]